MATFLSTPVGRMTIPELFLALLIFFAILYAIIWGVNALFKVPKNKQLHIWTPVTIGESGGGRNANAAGYAY